MSGNLSVPVHSLIPLHRGIDIVISAIFPLDARDQIPLIDAASQAGVKRFLPCNWGTPSARGGIMDLRDLKKDAHDHLFRVRLGFIIIDVGYWYQSSCRAAGSTMRRLRHRRRCTLTGRRGTC